MNARALEFPPLLTGIATPGDPFTAARTSVETEVEPGAVFYGSDPTSCQIALVLAPEEPLATALRVSFAATLGLNDALGALAPPEVACHLAWPDRILVNGAECGTLRVAASTNDPTCEPDWLITALDIPMVNLDTSEAGQNPEKTTLYDEGCGDITAPDLIESWARHTMNWLHMYLTEGFEPLHREWRGKGYGFGEAITYPERGTFIGLDETGGQILKTDSQTRIIPLTRLLETP